MKREREREREHNVRQKKKKKKKKTDVNHTCMVVVFSANRSLYFSAPPNPPKIYLNVGGRLVESMISEVVLLVYLSPLLY